MHINGHRIKNCNVCKLFAFAIIQVMLPWRWMALDSLTDRCCSTCTDVWSFGVTLWEIFTLGSVPYAGFEYDASFVKKISNGLRLGKPEHASDEM